MASQFLANIFTCNALPLGTYTQTYTSSNTQNVSMGAFLFANGLISAYSINSAMGTGATTQLSLPQYGYTYFCV
jgi:hypothetical protein